MVSFQIQQRGATSGRPLTSGEVVRVLGEHRCVELAEQGQDRLDVDEQLIDQTSNDEPRPETERESVSGKSLIRVQGRT